MAVMAVQKPESVDEIFRSAKHTVARLRSIGINSPPIMDELRQASTAIKSKDFENAYLFASRALKDARALHEAYVDSCIALSSARDLINDLKARNINPDGPENLARKARRLFEQSDYERALKYAIKACEASMGSCARHILLDRDVREPASNGGAGGAGKSLCKWQHRIEGDDNGSMCLNFMGSNYKHYCSGQYGCRAEKA